MPSERALVRYRIQTAHTNCLLVSPFFVQKLSATKPLPHSSWRVEKGSGFGGDPQAAVVICLDLNMLFQDQAKLPNV
jgi:hypothetical protein